MLPTHIKLIDLKNPCRYKYKIKFIKLFEFIKNIKNPQWLIVEYASIRLRSVWCDAIKDPYKHVQLQINKNISLKLLERTIIIQNLPQRYTPAETNVAEWIRAEAGTGASIESGNHVWKPNWADLQNDAKIIKMESIS